MRGGSSRRLLLAVEIGVADEAYPAGCFVLDGMGRTKVNLSEVPLLPLSRIPGEAVYLALCAVRIPDPEPASVAACGSRLSVSTFKHRRRGSVNGRERLSEPLHSSACSDAISISLRSRKLCHAGARGRE